MSRERILLRVEKGALVPANNAARDALRARGFKTGDTLLADLTKPRNPNFHRFAHAIGWLVAENVDSFSGLNAHAALKRLQVESGLACEERLVDIQGIGATRIITPRSLAFDKMDEGEFRQLIHGLCGFIVKKYWQDCSPEEIEKMAQAIMME